MIAHFLHRGGGGGPVRSNRAQLPHLNLTFPFLSLPCSFCLCLFLLFSPFLIFGTHAHTSQVASERSHLAILDTTHPHRPPLSAAYVCQLDLHAQLFSFAVSSQCYFSIRKGKLTKRSPTSRRSEMIHSPLYICTTHLYMPETHRCFHPRTKHKDVCQF